MKQGGATLREEQYETFVKRSPLSGDTYRSDDGMDEVSMMHLADFTWVTIAPENVHRDS